MTTRLTNPTSDLFARTVQLEPGQHVLLLQSGDAAFARWVLEQVGPEGHVTALHSSHRALQQLAAVPDLDVSDAVYPVVGTHGPAQVVLMAIPKGRSVTRALLWTAAQALEADGRLYLAGPNARGAKSAIKDAAALLGDAPVLDYRRSHRIALGLRPETLSLPADWGDERAWTPQIRGMQRADGHFMVMTMPGVFSWDRLDPGTALLLDHLDVSPDSDVLDIGCGYGVIGIVAARQGAKVVLVDDDLRAVRCARGTVHANDLSAHCEVLPSDVTQSVTDRTFDVVLSNPPFHKAVETDTGVAERIIREAAAVLRPDGRLRIVANRFLPYDGVMRETFGSVRIVAETSRYYVLESQRD